MANPLYSGSYTESFVPVLDDTTALVRETSALLGVTAGNVRVILRDDSAYITVPIAVGQILPLSCRVIALTGTTATVIGLR